MPVFHPPTRPQATGNAFWQRFTINVGVSVVLRSGHYVELPGPTGDDLIGVEGTDWFLGGHVYYVSDAVGALLLADGFDVDMDDGYGAGAYGDEEYGDA